MQKKIVLVIEKIFWISRLKTENLQQFEDKFFWTVKGQTNFSFEQNVFLTCSWGLLIN